MSHDRAPKSCRALLPAARAIFVLGARVRDHQAQDIALETVLAETRRNREWFSAKWQSLLRFLKQTSGPKWREWLWVWVLSVLCGSMLLCSRCLRTAFIGLPWPKKIAGSISAMCRYLVFGSHNITGLLRGLLPSAVNHTCSTTGQIMSTQYHFCGFGLRGCVWPLVNESKASWLNQFDSRARNSNNSCGIWQKRRDLNPRDDATVDESCLKLALMGAAMRQTARGSTLKEKLQNR